MPANFTREQLRSLRVLASGRDTRRAISCVLQFCTQVCRQRVLSMKCFFLRLLQINLYFAYIVLEICTVTYKLLRQGLRTFALPLGGLMGLNELRADNRLTPL